MDVQTENTDPPSCESQPSGKIRKGFKLFGKRKPGNIFSIRSKGDGNNKSPVNKTKNQDGLSETTAPDSEQEPDKENGQEVSQAEMEHGEEGMFGEDGVLPAAHAHASISSACSAKSLSFLSLLKGGRKGGGDRQVHTVSQPVARKRRGLKGLFNNVMFRPKDKEDQEEAPPSPLLMSSRTNSVEIIKEDLTLTPESKPRSLDSPKTESWEPVKSLTTQDSAAMTPSETATPQVTAGNVSTTDQHVSPLPTSESPLVPGHSSLSSLLADISSLLTFDSISGGGDIMADVEAEWGKASSAIGAAETEVTPSSTRVSSPAVSTFVSTAKPSPLAVPTTALNKSRTPLTKTISSSPPTAKPSSIITTLTKSPTLTTHSVRLSSDFTPASELSTTAIISTPTLATGKPSATLQTTTNLSPPIMSSPLMTIKSTPSSTSATVSKAPPVSPSLTSTVSKLASETAASPQMLPSEIKPSSVPTPPLAPAKTLPVTHSPPIPVAFTQPPPAKLDSANNLTLQASSSLSSAGRESKAPVTVSQACDVTTKLSSPSPVLPYKITTAPSSTTTSVALSKPAFSSSPVEVNQTTPSLVTVPKLCSSSTLTGTTKTELSSASVPTPSATFLDKIPPVTKTAPVPTSLGKMPPAPTMTPVPTTHAVVCTASPTPPALGQSLVSQSKTPPPPAQIPFSVSEVPPAPAHIQRSQSKAPPPLVQIAISVSKDPPASAHSQVSQTKAPSAPPNNPVSSSTDTSVLIPVVSKDSPAPAQISVSPAKAPATPTSPPVPFPVPSLTSPPAPWLSEAPAAATMTTGRQVSVGEQPASPSSADAPGAQAAPSKTDGLHNGSRTSLQGPSREKRTPHVKASGLSKIPVVGGGRVGKLPVRESQHADDETRREPPTPVLEERPHFNSTDGLSKDKIGDVRAGPPTSKCAQEESQLPPQPKVLTSLPRDSKIPLKYGAQSHAASQIPQEPPRTKIPVSKVPVRRAGKPAAAGGSTQMRK